MEGKVNPLILNHVIEFHINFSSESGSSYATSILACSVGDEHFTCI